MLYLILEKYDLDYLNSLTDKSFTELETDLMPDDFCLVHSKKDYLDVFEIMKRTKCRALALEPYVSQKTFANIYPKEIEKRLIPVELDNSFFSLLIANYKNLIPNYDNQFYLLPSMQPSINTMKYLLEIKRLNELLEINYLNITMKEVKMSLEKIFQLALRSILEAESRAEIIDYRETEEYNKNFYMLVVAEFVIQATYLYSKEDIENFLRDKLDIER